MENKPSKDQIIALLRKWINQRPGLDFREYGGNTGYDFYREDLKGIVQDGKDARFLLRKVELSSIDANTLLDGFRAYGGRLEINPTDKGEFRLSYTTGQYWPTEYRAAACAVLAQALWDYYRPDYMDDDNPGDKIRSAFRRMFGKRIQETWFD